MRTEKEKKYDRQLRLWQAHGQQALESAKICLINANATGTETLKNLVLPGIGSFTIVDDRSVTGADVGNNFFLTHDQIGLSRAKAAVDFLSELNDDVVGKSVDQKLEALLAEPSAFFSQFTLIIASDVPDKNLLKLADYCWSTSKPLVIVRSYGMFGYLRIVTPEHIAVEPHLDQTVDLRLDQPFQELKEYADTFDMARLSSADHSHVPFVVILLKSIKQWIDTNGKLPSNVSERRLFKELIASQRRTGALDEENFDEAISFALRACAKTEVPKHISKILEDEKCRVVTKDSSNFWVICRALREFVENEGNQTLPIAGGVPDMKASTEAYVKLQSIYRSKARSDSLIVQERVARILQELDKQPEGITAEEIERVCKNAQFMKLIRYRSLSTEYNPSTANQHCIAQELEDLESNMSIYVLLRSVNSFYEMHKRFPGTGVGDIEYDIRMLKKSVSTFLSSLQISPSAVTDEMLHAMVRAGASELHSVAALLGGIASQEIIKLITQQYIPLDNTLIFNGMKSTMSTFNL